MENINIPAVAKFIKLGLSFYLWKTCVDFHISQCNRGENHFQKLPLLGEEAMEEAEKITMELEKINEKSLTSLCYDYIQDDSFLYFPEFRREELQSFGEEIGKLYLGRDSNVKDILKVPPRNLERLISKITLRCEKFSVFTYDSGKKILL